MQTISIIAAMGTNREMGNAGKIPWQGKLPADFAYFKKVTLGHPIIMGRKTYESIGRPLPDRKNIVITRQQNYKAEGCEVVGSLEQALTIAGDGEVFVIGGAEIYREALLLASKMYITRVDGNFQADTYFPEFDMTQWQMIGDVPGLIDEKNILPYRFQVFEKKIE